MNLNQTATVSLWPARDPASAISHLAGFVLALIGSVALVIKGANLGGFSYALSFAVFGLTMMLLYLASASYHWLNLSPSRTLVLRKLDHAMIYVLIAGTYTPLCTIALSGGWGIGLLLTIWAIAIGGICLTVFYFAAPRRLTTGIYIAMGWLVVGAVVPLAQVLSLSGFAWLLAGGLFYTVGGIIYGRKRSPINFPGFGFHEVFHVFVLAGSICHYFLMLLVLAPL